MHLCCHGPGATAAQAKGLIGTNDIPTEDWEFDEIIKFAEDKGLQDYKEYPKKLGLLVRQDAGAGCTDAALD